MIKVGIIGATGYAGAELVRLLQNHPQAQIVWYGSRSYVEQKYADVYHSTFEIVDDICMDDNMEEMADQVDVIFTATPQGFCASALTSEILSRVKVIDLGADFRLKNPETYEQWYGIKHEAPSLLPEAVYGLCERNRQAVKEARLVANPGCYPTCSILSLYPLVREKMIDLHSIIIDAKSGVTGAGRSAKTDSLFCEVHDSIKAYGVTTHRHTPEIEEQLGIAAGEEVLLNFTPHLIPMERGILVTAYANLLGSYTYEDLKAVYDRYYAEEPFIRILPREVCPQTRWVKGSNYVDLNFQIDERTRRVIMMGALDNMVKGAAGQAVQNMNLMFGFEETTGLTALPMPF